MVLTSLLQGRLYCSDTLWIMVSPYRVAGRDHSEWLLVVEQRVIFRQVSFSVLFVENPIKVEVSREIPWFKTVKLCGLPCYLSIVWVGLFCLLTVDSLWLVSLWDLIFFFLLQVLVTVLGIGKDFDFWHCFFTLRGWRTQFLCWFGRLTDFEKLLGLLWWNELGFRD